MIYVAQRHEGGFSSLEVLVSLVITATILVVSYSLLIDQNKSYMAQQDVIQFLRESQAAMDILAKDLRMAGYGVPDAASRITAATGTTLTINGNFRRVSTNLRLSVLGGQQTLPVQDVTDFAVDDTIWITDGTNSESGTVSTVTGGGSPSLTMTGVLTNPYSAGSVVHQSRTITSIYDAVAQTVSRTVNGAAQQVILRNVTAFSFTYTYSGTAIPQNIRQITVSLTAQTARPLPDTGQHRTITYQTSVAPQNLAF